MLCMAASVAPSPPVLLPARALPPLPPAPARRRRTRRRHGYHADPGHEPRALAGSPPRCHRSASTSGSTRFWALMGLAPSPPPTAVHALGHSGEWDRRERQRPGPRASAAREPRSSAACRSCAREVRPLGLARARRQRQRRQAPSWSCGCRLGRCTAREQSRARTAPVDSNARGDTGTNGTLCFSNARRQSCAITEDVSPPQTPPSPHHHRRHTTPPLPLSTCLSHRAAIAVA